MSSRTGETEMRKKTMMGMAGELMPHNYSCCSCCCCCCYDDDSDEDDQ